MKRGSEHPLWNGGRKGGDGVIDYALLPTHLRDGMRRYIEDGIETGSFLRACLEGDTHSALLRGDPVSVGDLARILAFREDIPTEAWGSPAKVRAWIDSHVKALEASR